MKLKMFIINFKIVSNSWYGTATTNKYITVIKRFVSGAV